MIRTNGPLWECSPWPEDRVPEYGFGLVNNYLRFCILAGRGDNPGNSGAPNERMRCSSLTWLTCGPSVHSPPMSSPVAIWMASFGLLAQIVLA